MIIPHCDNLTITANISKIGKLYETGKQATSVRAEALLSEKQEKQPQNRDSAGKCPLSSLGIGGLACYAADAHFHLEPAASSCVLSVPLCPGRGTACFILILQAQRSKRLPIFSKTRNIQNTLNDYVFTKCLSYQKKWSNLYSYFKINTFSASCMQYHVWCYR